MLIRRFHVMGRKLVAGSAGLLLGWTGTGMLAAQVPMPLPLGPAEQAVAPTAAPAPAPAQRIYLNKSMIQLPIRINEQSLSLISEIQLFVKDSPNAQWTQRDKVGPGAKAFTFQVPRDGEYWFAMVTVDKQGRGFPSDLRNEAPGLVVVIDTQLPEIELTNLGNTPNGHLVQVDVRDANLDNGGTRFYYQGGDKVFRMLDSVPGRPNVYCVPPQAVFTGMVRATADDLAQNQAVREVHLNQMATVKAAPAPATQPQTLVFPQQQPPELKKPAGIETARMPIGTGPVGVPEFRPINDAPPILPPKDTVGAIRPDYKGGARVIEHKSDSPPNVAAPVITPPETLKRQFVNSTKLFLDYQIENAAQNSVAKVEVWVTRDRAKTWQKISEQAQHKSPVEVAFPGEGIFGVTLVATNSRGVPGAPPAAGDAPDMWVEVDTTKPSAQFTKVHATQEDGKSVVHIHWTASDQNLGDAPVELSYSATPVGPWQPIAKGLKAEGQHRWTPPSEVGAKAYLRLSVRDAAGNTTVVGTQDAVVLEEPAPPRAIIRGISTNTTTPPPSLPSPPTLRLAPGSR